MDYGFIVVLPNLLVERLGHLSSSHIGFLQVTNLNKNTSFCASVRINLFYMIDFNSDLGRKARKLLDSEYVIWLTTVGKDGTPQPRPVWFIPHHGGVLIYSQPTTSKVAHVRRHPQVALHFNTDAHGDENVIVFTGVAKLDAAIPPSDQVPAYIEKYRQGIADLNSTVEKFTHAYSQAVFVELASMRGW